MGENTQKDTISIKPGNPVNVYLNGKIVDPGPSLKVFNHSPTGFNVGYLGSGPAQAALGILMKVTDKITAVRLHQDF